MKYFFQKQFQSYIPFAFVLSIIAFEYYTYQFTYMPAQMLDILQFNVFFILLLISYVRCWATQNNFDPEHITGSFDLNQLKLKAQQNQGRQRRSHQLDMEAQNDINPMGFCLKCNQIKPQRAHHCKTCQTCILRMDHHCPWTGNCIGVRNHKYFILFLFYTAICLGQITFNMYQDMYKLIFLPGKVQSYQQQQLICWALALGIWIAIDLLLLFQIALISKNVTTLECYDSWTYNPYNINLIENFKSVMGNNISFWLLPISPDHQIYHEYINLL